MYKGLRNSPTLCWRWLCCYSTCFGVYCTVVMFVINFRWHWSNNLFLEWEKRAGFGFIWLRRIQEASSCYWCWTWIFKTARIVRITRWSLLSNTFGNISCAVIKALIWESYFFVKESRWFGCGSLWSAPCKIKGILLIHIMLSNCGWTLWICEREKRYERWYKSLFCTASFFITTT